jgi:CHASE3 domain sensor protein
MFENLNLRNRILLGYSVPIGISVIVAGAIFVGVGNVSRLSESVQDANNILIAAEAAALDITELQKTSRGYMLQKNDASRTAYNKAWADFAKDSKETIDAIKDPEQKKIAEDIAKLGAEVKAYNDVLIAQVDAGNANGAIATWRIGEGRKFADELDKLTAKFIADEVEILTERRAARAAGLNYLTATVIVGALLSAGVSIALAYLISATISNQVKEAASAVGSSSAEIAATLEQQDRTTSQQATSVNETTTTVEELGASSRQSAEQADASAAGAKEALAITENGLRSVEQTIAFFK